MAMVPTPAGPLPLPLPVPPVSQVPPRTPLDLDVPRSKSFPHSVPLPDVRIPALPAFLPFKLADTLIGIMCSDGASYWDGLKPYRGKTKTNGESGKKRRFYEWDYTHGDVEVYAGRGNHLGSASPQTGEMTKPPVPGRKISL